MTEAKKGRQTGRVTLLGAGCHDVSWLTLAGKQALQQADVVICDDLIDRSLLSLAPQAQIIAMGKRGHRKSASQEAINEQMAALAGQNREVVRLKGGDPMVFGRGMEEAEHLRRRGIDVRILPGISSFLGVPAKEQLALTLRGCSRGFMVLTAASAHGQRTARQWKTIADFEGTRVFLMGMSRIDSIARSLMEAGLDGETRCAAMTSPAMTCTKSVYAPLRDLAVQCETAHLASPGILLIGGSVPEKPLLDFVRIGFVCTGRLQARIADRLPARFQCVSLAKIQTQVFEHSWKERLNEKKRPDWLVFTSAQGVDLFFEQLRGQRVDLRALAGIQLAAIGPATARALENHGLYTDLVSEPSCSQALARALKEKVRFHSRICLVRSAQADPVLQEILSGCANVETVILYSTSIEILPDPGVDAIVFGSLMEAKAWKEARCSDLPVDIPLIAISARVAGTLQDCTRQRIVSAERPSSDELAALIEQTFDPS